MRNLLHILRKLWRVEEDSHMRKVAMRYSLRAQMDGHIVRKTGEVIPKESV